MAFTCLVRVQIYDQSTGVTVSLICLHWIRPVGSLRKQRGNDQIIYKD